LCIESKKQEKHNMFRKVMILLLMTPLLAAAVATGSSLPILGLMSSLLLAALALSSARSAA
jgi:hypothetical protein